MSENTMDYEGQEMAVGSSIDLSTMSVEERVNAMERGDIVIRGTGMFRVLKPDAVKVPHVHGHPVGMINKRDPLNSDNIMSYKPTTSAYAQTDSSIEAGHQFVDMFHAIAQPKPGDKTIYTARIVPNSIHERQVKMAADLKGPNPANRLLNPGNSSGADPRRRASRAPATRADQGGHHRGGRRGRGRRNNRGRNNRGQNDGRNDRSQNADPPVSLESEKEELDREMDEYFASNPAMTEGEPIEVDRFMADQ
ncbi:hypothetical protein GGR58DRAFT_492659 [Xylaria digitata]|nr:hypothetical protein GGR58DRAFT_492659 [Xylaria digitata]